MKYFLTLLTLAIFLLVNSAVVIAQCAITAPEDVAIPCGTSTTLTANNNFVTYQVIESNCGPLATNGTNAFPTTCDDCVTGDLNIGFPFNFYGTTYSTVRIQTNGIIGFGGLTYTGYMPYPIPALGEPDNYIAGLYADIDIRYGGTITYRTEGTAPNRRFVVSYTNVVPYNSGSAGTGTASFQIVLHENGSFQVIISQLSDNWYSSTSGAVITSGAESTGGNFAFVVPGRNAEDPGAIVPSDQDCWIYNPVPCSFVRWRQGATQLTTSNVLTVSPAVSTTYTAEWNCGGIICTDETVVTVQTAVIATNVEHCQNAPSQPLTISGANCLSTPTLTSVNQNTVFNTGSLSTTDPTYSRPFGGTSCSSSNTAYYDVLTFTVSTTGSYTFNMCHNGATWDGHAAIFQNAFNPANPCAIPANFVIANDDGNSGTCSAMPSLTATLTAGTTYYLVTSAFSNGTTGNYQWTYTGPGGATISTVVPTALPVEWYTTLTGGTPIGTGLSFNPVGVAGSGLANTSTPGTYNFYVGCQGSSSCRTLVTYTISPVDYGINDISHCVNEPGQSVTIAATPVVSYAPGQVFNAGALATTDPTFVRSTSVTSCGLTAGTSHYYDVFSFTVSVSGNYVFNNCAPSFDAYAILFSGGFNGASPCSSTFIIGNDDSSTLGCTNDPQISTTLTAGVVYYLVTTSFSAGITGAYDWQFSTTTGGVVQTNTPSTYNWYTVPTGGTPIHSGNTLAPVGLAGSMIPNTASATSVTYYVANAQFPACRDQITYTINASVGNPAVYGDNTWNVYSYNDNGVYANGAVTGNYYGFYSQSLTGNLGFDTDATGYWAPATNSSMATNYQGCALPISNDHFTFVHKRKGFPCGTYRLVMNDWDDATSIIVNGVTVWSCTNNYGTANVCPTGRAANAASTIGVYALDANSEIEVRTSEGTGTSRANLSIVPVVGELGPNNTARTCPVSGNEWVHFYGPVNGEYLGSVRGTTPTSNLGNVTMTVYDDNNPLNVPACDMPSYITAVMERHWVITPTINGAGVVLLPYYNEEYTQLVGVANANTNTNDNISVQSDVLLSKYSGGTFPASINVNNSPFDNCPASGGTGNTELFAPIANGLNTLLNSTYNGNINLSPTYSTIMFSAYQIGGFSEFWLHANNINSPLPVSLEEASMKCDEGKIIVNWTTAVEINSDYFQLEGSNDGFEWEFIEQVDGAGNTTTSTSYALDTRARFDYYRLTQTDFDGEMKVLKIAASPCLANGDANIEVKPNPSTGDFVVTIYNKEKDVDVTVNIMDLQGKIVSSKVVSMMEGSTSVYYNEHQLAKGTYMLVVNDNNKNLFKPFKLVIQ